MHKMISLFSGVGGIDLGFEETGAFETVYANEFNVKSAETYLSNFPPVLETKDIHAVDTMHVPDADILLSGFPCQAFSIAGYRKGFSDDRGDLFFETLRFIQDKDPDVIFLENVKNLVTHDKGKTFEIICDALTQNGYHLAYQVLNAKDYANVPQNRERIYIVGFKDKSRLDKFSFPKKQVLSKSLSDFIDFDSKMDDKYYYTAQKQTFHPLLKQSITRQDRVYQWRRQYVRENKSGVCPTLTANMGTGGHNVPLVLTKHGIRKLTPRECFNLQGYPTDYVLPDLAMSHLYQQAGNSVVVPMITLIAEEIKKALQ